LSLGLPLIIHSRESLDDCWQALSAGGGFATRVVLHCFTGHADLAPRFLERGCWLGMDGPVTFPKADEARKVASETPLDRLLLETDCPYLAPQSVRGRRCEPAHVRDVAAGVAACRGLAVEDVIAASGAAAAAFFGWEMGS